MKGDNALGKGGDNALGKGGDNVLGEGDDMNVCMNGGGFSVL